MLLGAEDLARIECIAALVSAAVVTPLAGLAPHLRPTAAPLAGGQLVLLGPGMYVNRGLAMGLGVEVTNEDLEVLEASSAAAGVPPEVEVASWAHPSLLDRTAERGYHPVGFRSTLLRRLPAEPPGDAGLATIEEVADEAALGAWQATAAEGFGYTTQEERAVSDLYVAAVSQLEGAHLFVARISGRPVAVASLTIRDDVAILGGMTTVPAARGQGLQQALIGHRLATAARAGCQIALSTAAPAAGSERNLRRAGFGVASTTLTMRRPPPG